MPVAVSATASSNYATPHAPTSTRLTSRPDSPPDQQLLPQNKLDSITPTPLALARLVQDANAISFIEAKADWSSELALHPAQGGHQTFDGRCISQRSCVNRLQTGNVIDDGFHQVCCFSVITDHRNVTPQFAESHKFEVRGGELL